MDLLKIFSTSCACHIGASTNPSPRTLSGARKLILLFAARDLNAQHTKRPVPHHTTLESPLFPLFPTDGSIQVDDWGGTSYSLRLICAFAVRTFGGRDCGDHLAWKDDLRDVEGANDVWARVNGFREKKAIDLTD
jgi:hypothetical protein